MLCIIEIMSDLEILVGMKELLPKIMQKILFKLVLSNLCLYWLVLEIQTFSFICLGFWKIALVNF